MKNGSGAGGLVYSTDGGRMCPGCRQPVARCSCGHARTAGAPDAVVRVSLETKGRGGKAVTVIRGLGLEPEQLTQLGKQLRASCGSGGTVKEGVIELQGDHADRVLELLQAQGRSVKRAGG